MRLSKLHFPVDHSIRNPVFRKLAMGSSFNSLGWQGEQVILGLLTYELTGASLWVGIVLALNFAPMFFVGVPAGVLADRFDRRSLLIRAEIVLVIALVAFALLLSQDTVAMPSVMGMSVISGIVRSAQHPARLSYAGDMAGKGGMIGTLSLLSIVSRIGQLSGALIAGYICEYATPATAYFVLAMAHVLAVFCFMQTTANRAGIERKGKAETTSIRVAVMEYFRFMRSSHLLVVLILFATLTEVFGFSFATAMPEIAIERLHAGADDLGLMHAFRNAGGLFGAIVVTLLTTKRLGLVYLVVLSAFGIALVMFGRVPTMLGVLMAVAMIAVFASASDILVQSMMQLSVPVELRGRAMGAWVVALGMGPVGHLELGLLISFFGTASALYFNGIVLLIIGVVGYLFVPSVRFIRDI
jgi:ENTS family enterobactin (siderophore) exporter